MSTSAPRLLVLLLIYAAFVSMGLPDGMLGAAWPSMRPELGVSLDDNWLMLLLGTCGAALSSFSSGIAVRTFGMGRVLVATTTLTALVICGYALSPNLGLITLLAFFLGLGNGSIDAGLNHFVASTLSSRHMSWLHAFWGVGVSLGTLGITVAFAAGGTWRTAYAAVGLVQFCLGLAFVLNLKRLPAVPRAVNDPKTNAPYARATFGLRVTWLSMAAFFTYCGLECSAGLWIASVLYDGRGFSLEAVASMTTLYWASLTVGRFAIGMIATRVPAIRLVRLGVGGAILGTLFIAGSGTAAVPPALSGFITALGLLLTGLSLSPIYPMLMHDTPRVVGASHALNLIGYQGGAGQIGFTLVPIAIGALLSNYSTAWLGPLLAALAVILLSLILLRERAVISP